MLVSEQATMGITLYQNQAEQLLKDYVLADSFIPCTSIIGGIFASKVVFLIIAKINCGTSVHLKWLLLICSIHTLSTFFPNSVSSLFSSLFSSFKRFLVFRSMILPRRSVLFTSRAMPAFQKCSVLSGITGVEYFPIQSDSFSPSLLQIFYIC